MVFSTFIDTSEPAERVRACIRIFFSPSPAGTDAHQLSWYSRRRMSDRPRILIVDDEPSVLVTYQLILEQHGFSVIGVSSTPAAMQALDANHFDVVVCDLQLETQRSGFDIIRAARARDATIPAILLTGYATTEAADEATRNGIIVVYKPVDVQEFLPMLEGLAKRK